ncbi:MAG: hypothetical protein ACYDBK_06150 [Thermoplasmataceae archaeon]
MHLTLKQGIGIAVASALVISMALYASTLNISRTLPGDPQDYLPADSSELFSFSDAGLAFYGFHNINGTGIVVNASISTVENLLNISTSASSSQSYSISPQGRYLGQPLETLEISGINLSASSGTPSAILKYIFGMNSTTVNLTISAISGTNIILLGDTGGVKDSIATANTGTWHPHEFMATPYYVSIVIYHASNPLVSTIWVNMSASSTYLTFLCNSPAAATILLITTYLFTGKMGHLDGNLAVEYTIGSGFADLVYYLTGGL